MAVLLGLIYSFQGRLLYMPQVPGPTGRKYAYSPKDFGLEYEDMRLLCIDGTRIHAWLIKHPLSGEVPTLVYLHGNAGNISHRLEHVKELVKRSNVNVVLVSYRGYGSSEGSPSEAGLQMDAQAVLDHLLNRVDIDKRKICLLGVSLGGGVAIAAAHANPGKVCAVLLENTFTSIDDLVDILFPVLKPFKFLLRNHWPSLRRIKDLECGLLFLSGEKDELIPPWMMRSLHDTAKSSVIKEFRSYVNGTHNDTWYVAGQPYYTDIHRFLLKATGETTK